MQKINRIYDKIKHLQGLDFIDAIIRSTRHEMFGNCLKKTWKGLPGWKKLLCTVS